MEKTRERRSEERLRYQCPIWFAEDFKQTLSTGLMVDVSSGGMAFTCNADENCPYLSQQLTARFSIPEFSVQDSSAVTGITRTGRALRIDNVNSFLRRVAIQFDEPLSLKPCEQAQTNLVHSKIGFDYAL